MIVKNESLIITRLFESIKDVFDTYCICDTGSVDDTPEIIKKWMNEHNKQGFVIHEPFKNFGYNRTHGILEAQKYISSGQLKGDYFLFLDADMRLVVTNKFSKDMLTNNAYSIIQKSPVLSYHNVRFVKTSCKVTSMGVTHEYYDIPEGGICKIEEQFIYIDDIGDGGSKGDKAERDIRLLSEGIADENTPQSLKGRYYFYRANTFFDTNRLTSAIDDYKQRIEIGGWIEEVWYSKYRIGLALERLNKLNDATIAYLSAYQHHPKRAEPLYELVKMNRVIGNRNLAYMFYNTAKQIPYPKDDVLFINRTIYDYLLDYELSVIGYYVGHPDIDKLITKILNNPNNTINFQHMMSNYKFYCKKLQFASVQDFTDNTFFEGFSSSTPCILETNKGFMLLVRHHNYSINTDGSYSNGDKITSNYSVNILDKTLAKRSSYKIEEPDALPGLRYVGIEDVKLFKLGDTVYFVGTAQNPQTQKLSVALGKRSLTHNNSRLEYKCIPSPGNRECEKNWALFSTDDKTLKVVYEWENFKTYTISENGLSDFSTKTTPYFFKFLRGSSNGYKQGDNIWFVCHLVNFEPHRSYYHVIVIYNHVKDTFAFTVPFKFEGKNVEYSLGLVVEDKNILISYSTDDKTSKVAVLEKREFCKLLLV